MTNMVPVNYIHIPNNTTFMPLPGKLLDERLFVYITAPFRNMRKGTKLRFALWPNHATLVSDITGTIWRTTDYEVAIAYNNELVGFARYPIADLQQAAKSHVLYIIDGMIVNWSKKYGRQLPIIIAR